MSHPWEPSQAYLDYCKATKKERLMAEMIPSYGKSLAGREHTAADDALWATQTPSEAVFLPFSPCPRFRPIPTGCAACIHSIADVLCPELTRAVQSIADQGGVPSTLVSESNTEVSDVEE